MQEEKVACEVKLTRGCGAAVAKLREFELGQAASLLLGNSCPGLSLGYIHLQNFKSDH